MESKQQIEKLVEKMAKVKNYERDHSHYHCWEQKSPACGLNEHSRCCLCEKVVNIPRPKDTKSEVSIPDIPSQGWVERYQKLVNENYPGRQMMYIEFELLIKRIQDFISTELQSARLAEREALKCPCDHDASRLDHDYLLGKQEGIKQEREAMRERVERMRISPIYVHGHFVRLEPVMPGFWDDKKVDGFNQALDAVLELLTQKPTD